MGTIYVVSALKPSARIFTLGDEVPHDADFTSVRRSYQIVVVGCNSIGVEELDFLQVSFLDSLNISNPEVIVRMCPVGEEECQDSRIFGVREDVVETLPSIFVFIVARSLIRISTMGEEELSQSSQSLLLLVTLSHDRRRSKSPH